MVRGVNEAACTLVRARKPAHFDIDRIVRPNILTLEPYRCARDDYQDGVLLDANENALGAVVAPADAGDARLHRHERVPTRFRVLAPRVRRGLDLEAAVGADRVVDRRDDGQAAARDVEQARRERLVVMQDVELS